MLLLRGTTLPVLGGCSETRLRTGWLCDRRCARRERWLRGRARDIPSPLGEPGFFGDGCGSSTNRNLAPTGGNKGLNKGGGALRLNACSCCIFLAACDGGLSPRPYMA
jgi:hypothetical protein